MGFWFLTWTCWCWQSSGTRWTRSQANSCSSRQRRASLLPRIWESRQGWKHNEYGIVASWSKYIPLTCMFCYNCQASEGDTCKNNQFSIVWWWFKMVMINYIDLKHTRADSLLLRSLSLDYTPADSLFSSIFWGEKQHKVLIGCFEIFTSHENGGFRSPMET